MNKRLKQSMLTGATIATLGIAGLTGAGLASADSTTSGGQGTLIDTLVSKFNLDKSEVEAVFTADRQEHHAQMETERAAQLAQAVTDGKLTQAQADYITAAHKEIADLMGSGEPGQESDATRTSIRDKMDALRTWATENNVAEQYVGGGPGGRDGHGGPGGHGPRGMADSNSDDSQSSTGTE